MNRSTSPLILSWTAVRVRGEEHKAWMKRMVEGSTHGSAAQTHQRLLLALLVALLSTKSGLGKPLWTPLACAPKWAICQRHAHHTSMSIIHQWAYMGMLSAVLLLLCGAHATGRLPRVYLKQT